MKLFRSAQVKELEHHATVVMLHFQSQFDGSASPALMEELVWGSALDDCADLYAQIVENGEERRALRLLRTIGSVLGSSTDQATWSEFMSWCKAVQARGLGIEAE